ncbi:glycosyltransferase [Candidatus Villigracilis affinis]|uniref:glycosyltransferase n=1 Tax=Candidatus Villigracilis affinis TaxID=3140682 RepID=UPI002A1C7433|nr:glycosyltransferase [Anaerolineales bacterium]
MHIANFTNTYLPVISGVVRSVRSFRDELTHRGHNVFIFAQEQMDYTDKDPFIFRYPSLNLPTGIDIPTAIPISPFIDRLIPAIKLDVIHTHHPFLLGNTAATKAQELNLPLVFTFHTQYREYTHYVPFPMETVQNFIKSTVDRLLQDFMRRCQHIIIPSESMRETLVNNYGLKNNFTVIPTGVDLEAYRTASGEKIRKKRRWEKDIVMISIGRLAPEKNWPTLLHAAALVIKDIPQFRFVLIGDGTDRKSLEELAKELGIQKRVTFTGSLSFAETPSYMKAANLFGFASITETQGLATLEAMAAGLPVVAVEASGTRDILKHGQQGYLVENNPEALAAAIKRLLSNPERMQKFAQAAYKKAQSFNIENLTGKLLDVYEQAIRDKKKNRYVTVVPPVSAPAESVAQV